MLKSKAAIVSFFIVTCMSLKGMEDRRVLVKTTDKKMIRLSESVLEESTLLYTQYISKKAKNIEKIIVFAPVDQAGIVLFKDSMISLEHPAISFEKYYNQVEDSGLLEKLINVAGALKSGKLTAQLVHNYFPADMSEYITSFVMHSATEALRYKIIEKNYTDNDYVKLIHPISFDPLIVREQMASCGCTSEVNYQAGVLSSAGSVFVEVDPLDGLAPVLCCKKTDRALALLGHKFPITSVHFSPNDSVLLTCDYNDATNAHRIVLWDITRFEQMGEVSNVKEINGHSSIKRIAFYPSSERFVVALDNGIFRIYSGTTGMCIQYNGGYDRVKGKTNGVCCPGILFGCDGRLLVMMNFGIQSSCSLWNAKTGKRICGLHDKFRAFKEGCLLEDGSIVAAYLTELSGGEKLDLLGDHNRKKLAQFCDVMRKDMLSVYALWRWTLDENSKILSDDESSLKGLVDGF